MALRKNHTSVLLFAALVIAMAMVACSFEHVLVEVVIPCSFLFLFNIANPFHYVYGTWVHTYSISFPL
jgi:hypothetical protein